MEQQQQQRIGEYLVRRLVGEGGMGKVYEAEERLTRRRVALKVLRPELARSEEGRRLFLNEMQILAHLDHPGVVRCLACTEVDGELVMALEFLEGKTLRELLVERGRLGWDEAVGIALQVADALGAAHRQEPQIVHRDLKPENVIVMPDGHVKVMDFGIAKVLQALSKTTTHSVGTLQYMSPEQIDAAGVDARSDLYALGLVLYEMIVGKAPFESASPRELLNMQCTMPPPPLTEDARRGLPRGVERLIFALLEKRPDDRPATAEEVARVLEPFSSAEDGPRGATVVPLPVRTGDTALPVALGTSPSAAGATARRPSESGPPRADTIALVERASAARTISTAWALGIVLALSAVAGVTTYFVKTAVTSGGK